MVIEYSKSFVKSYKKRISHSKKMVRIVDERVSMFQEDSNNPLLKKHNLRGAKKNLSSFSVTGDVRIVYLEEKNKVIFLDIGTHNQVY